MAIFSRIILPFFLLVYIGVESYLKLQHSSLCGAVGCKLAGEIVRFDAMYLNYAGFVGVSFLLIFGILSLKFERFKTLFLVSVYTAIAFETTMFGYQIVVNPQLCTFCLGIFSSLVVIAFFASMKNFVFVLPSIIAVFIALNSLSLTQNKSFVTEQGLYLIHSSSCSHCKKVKTYFAQEEIKYHLISINQPNAKAFLKFVDISSIPVLVIKEKSMEKVIQGDKAIIAYFESLKTPPQKEDESAFSPPPPSSSSAVDLSTFLGPDEGCAITVTPETPACESNSSQ